MTYPVIKLRGSYSPALSLTNATVKDAPLTSLELDTNFYNISSLMETLAPKIAPTFIGNATVENPALSSNTTRIANTYFVNQKLTDYTPTATLTTQLSAKADLAGPTFTGTPLGPTASAGTNTTQLATTAFVDASFATKASPTFTGSVNLTGATTTAATPADSSDNQTVATTAHVKNVLTDYGLSTNTTLSTAYAAKAGATFTGVLRAPTPVDSSGNPDYTDHSTKVATTEWINGRFDNKADVNNETLINPTISNATATGSLTLSSTPLQTETDVQKVFGMLHQCIEEIRDGDTIYYKTDMTKKDLEQFVDQLSTNQFEDILEFFNSMPKLRHIVEIENPKTKVKNTIVLEGLSDFLV